jgi:hypothetical protein
MSSRLLRILPKEVQPLAWAVIGLKAKLALANMTPAAAVAIERLTNDLIFTI